MLELLTKDQFIDSLPDEDMRRRIRQNRPDSLQQVLQTALELESYQLASKQHAKTVREVHLEDSQAVTTNAAILEKVQQCMEALQHHTTEVAKGRGRRRATFAPGKEGDRRDPVSHNRSISCWNCGEQGHIRRECKKAQRRETNMEPVQGNGQ